MNGEVPDRFSQWRQWCQFVFTEFGQCEIGENRIRDRDRWFHTAYIIELTCTHETYKRCVEALLELYEGYCLSYKSGEKRTLGREYNYVIVFTKDPADADNYYIDDDGVLRYFKQQD